MPRTPASPALRRPAAVVGLVAFCIALCVYGSERLHAQATAIGPSAPIEIDNRTIRNAFLPQRDEPRTERLALGGFCPVTLRDQSKWVRGSSELSVVYDGLRYQFTDQRHLEIFYAAPDAYAVVLNGDCPVVYYATGQRSAGQLKFGLIHNGRIYFFASAEHRRKFTESPDSYADADLYGWGKCLISFVEEKQTVEGNPAAQARHDGIRFRFASVHYRDQFLANPDRYLKPGALGDAPYRTVPAELASKAPAGRPAIVAPDSLSDATPADDPGEPEVVVPLAMSGYCPVTIRDEGSWVRGRGDQRVIVDNLTFTFSGRDQKDTFLADPGRYMPVLAGNCPVTYAATHKRIPGNIYHTVLLPNDGLLFLFASAEEKSAFKANPTPYLRIDVAAEGNCVVTQREQNETIPGDPLLASWYSGFRYYFANDEARQKFLADPQRYAIDLYAPQKSKRPNAGQVASEPSAATTEKQDAAREE
ncbi:MAG: hypothetical protein KDA61_18890 [Planctomycetales bacterium]|nr:hypothetical protein [Planctomycetales bacterium]